MINAQYMPRRLCNPYVTPVAQQHPKLPCRKGILKRERPRTAELRTPTLPTDHFHRRVIKSYSSHCVVVLRRRRHMLIYIVDFLSCPLYPFRNSVIAESSKLIDETCHDTFPVPSKKADVCLQIDGLHM